MRSHIAPDTHRRRALPGHLSARALATALTLLVAGPVVLSGNTVFPGGDGGPLLHVAAAQTTDERVPLPAGATICVASRTLSDAHDDHIIPLIPFLMGDALPDATTRRHFLTAVFMIERDMWRILDMTFPEGPGVLVELQQSYADMATGLVKLSPAFENNTGAGPAGFEALEILARGTEVLRSVMLGVSLLEASGVLDCSSAPRFPDPTFAPGSLPEDPEISLVTQSVTARTVAKRTRVVVEVRNDGPTSVGFLDPVAYDIFDVNGSSIGSGSADYLIPGYVDPGELGYLVIPASELPVGATDSLDGLRVEIRPDAHAVDPSLLAPITIEEVRLTFPKYGSPRMSGTAVNSGTTEVDSFKVALLLFDASGGLLGADSTTVYETIPAGGSVRFADDLYGLTRADFKASKSRSFVAWETRYTRNWPGIRIALFP